MNLFNLFTGKYLFSFAVEGNLKFTKDDTTTLQSVFYFCHLSGEFCGIIIARFLHIKYIVLGDAAGSLMIANLLAVFGSNNATALWILVGFLAFFVSAVYPAG